jgi:hypothetical protein
MSFKGLFSKYVADESAVSDDQPQTSPSARVLVAITNADPDMQLVSGSLYDAVSMAVQELKVWMVESLAPLPVMSKLSDPKDEVAVLEVLDYCRERGLRIVFVKGTVEWGNVGKGVIMSFGSTGAIVSTLLEAAIILPRNDSWGTFHITNDLPNTEERSIAGQAFLKAKAASGISK